MAGSRAGRAHDHRGDLTAATVISRGNKSAEPRSVSISSVRDGKIAVKRLYEFTGVITMLFNDWRAEAARIAAGMYDVEFDRVSKPYLWSLYTGGIPAKSLRDSGGCGVGLSAIPREEIVGSGRVALS